MKHNTKTPQYYTEITLRYFDNGKRERTARYMVRAGGRSYEVTQPLSLEAQIAVERALKEAKKEGLLSKKKSRGE